MKTVNQIAEEWNITPRRVRKMCEENIIVGAKKENNNWLIPDTIIKPIDKRKRFLRQIVICSSSKLACEVLSLKFISLNYEVCVISNENIDIKGVKLYKCNINDYQTLSKILEQFKRIDGLIIFPSGYLPKTIESTSSEEFDEFSNLIVKWPYNILKYSIKGVREAKGSIVLLHSSVAINPEVGSTIYSMLQSTLIMLGKSLAIREGKFGVKVNNVALGPARTDTLLQKVTRNQINEWKNINPLGVSFNFEDCVQIITNLIISKDGYEKMTGTVIPIDGGESIADAYVKTQKGVN